MRRFILLIFLLLFAFSVTGVAASNAKLTELGTVTPPSEVDGYAITYQVSTLADLANTSVLPSSLGDITLNQSLQKHIIGRSWATWSHGYTGEVFVTEMTNTVTSRTLTMPDNTGAFVVYVEPNQFIICDTTLKVIDAQGDTASYTKSINGNAGAYGFAFTVPPGSRISSVTISFQSEAFGFALGEFGVSEAKPAPTPIPTGTPDLSPVNNPDPVVTNATLPKTGDNTPIALLMLMAIISLGCGVCVYARKR